MIEAQSSNGDAPMSNVLQAKRTLLGAQLEASAISAERIALREELLENMRQFEELVGAQVDSGKVPMSNLLEIRAARIKAEIELAKEKQ